ncbi:uncharacterized protein LOC128127378 [Lactuca sativa]|uniref:uncharacterized protein LOC128127378 n=1 Tax=Lactuca sativa TaxID=4236 RepID=UPI0022AF45BF|nr:uncharacterized protein LOC128127378 [Lactuca sativa]
MNNPNRKWMYERKDNCSCVSLVFVQGVKKFIDFATSQHRFMDEDKSKCPCIKCRNIPYRDVDIVNHHLYKSGFLEEYWFWDKHGETSIDDDNMFLGVDDSNTNFNEVDKELWSGLTKVTQISAVARLLNIKSEYHIPVQSYDVIYQLINDVLPEGNNMVGSLFESKRLIQALGLPMEMIDCCRYKRSKNLAKCSHVSFKKMNYFPLTPRLKRLYASQAITASMRWHSENHGHDARVMCHLSDSEAWKHFDKIHHSFATEIPLMWKISDFIAYEMLSGWLTAGKMACPHCGKHTHAFRLKNGNKMSCFDCHRRLLQVIHPYRKDKYKFKKNRVVTEGPHLSKNDEQTLREIEQLGLVKVTELNVDDVNNKCGDHVMDVKGKMKDNVAARKDLKLYCRKGKGVEYNERAYYALDKNQKKVICEWVEKLRFPDGYISKLGRCVDLIGCRLFRMKSHDRHVFMQRLMSIAFHEMLPKHVWEALTELSIFFKTLTITLIKTKDMERIETEIPIILCKLETIFVPGIFYFMEHLPKDFAFQEDEVESSEIIIPSTADTDNYDDHDMSSSGSGNENNINEEGEIHEDDNDVIPDSEGSYEYSTSSNEEEDDEEEEEEEDND